MTRRPWVTGVLLGMLLALSACFRFGVEELQQTPLNGNPFQNALAKAYLTFSQYEAKQYDWVDADYFARKGIKAAEGNDVEPEKVEDWNIPAKAAAPLIKAREQLLKVANDTAKRVEPVAAAKAYMLFDCWVEQQEEEEWQPGDVDGFRNDFFDTIDYLSVAADKWVQLQQTSELDVDPVQFEMVVQESDAGEKKKPKEKKSESVKSSHVIFFDTNSASITDAGKSTINTVIDELTDIPEYHIILNGYADRAGNVEYNKRLSEKRTKVVERALVARGVVQDAIEARAFGERDGGANADDESDANARVVEIFVH